MNVLCQPGGLERRELPSTHGVLITDGKSVWQYLPERGVVLKRPASSDAARCCARSSCSARSPATRSASVPSGPIAGRPSRVVEFTPRQAGSRPQRLVWVDAETGLILRTEVYDSEQAASRGSRSSRSWSTGRPSTRRPSRMRVPPGVRVVEAGAETCLEPAEAERVAGLPVGLPDYLPAGFARQCIRARRQRDYGEIQVVFGDGLSLLSLFESTSFRDPVDDPAGASAGRRRPRDRALARPRARDGDLLARAVGAPRAARRALPVEMHKVAGSVRRQPELSAPAAHQ